jgi:hypothetical protein
MAPTTCVLRTTGEIKSRRRLFSFLLHQTPPHVPYRNPSNTSYFIVRRQFFLSLIDNPNTTLMPPKPKGEGQQLLQRPGSCVGRVPFRRHTLCFASTM